jgi:hypothetical protein
MKHTLVLLALFWLLVLAPNASSASTATNTETGLGSCLKYSSLPSYKVGTGLFWTGQLDSTACAGNLPFVARISVHLYKDQGMTVEVPIPEVKESDAALLSATTMNFLIDRSERVNITGIVQDDRKDVKATHYNGIRAQVVGGAEGQTLIKSLQEARADEPHFCKHYVSERFTGNFKVYPGTTVPQEVTDLSLSYCLRGKARAMALKAVREQVDASGSSRRYLNVNTACSVPDKDNKNGTCMVKAHMTWMDYAPWTITGTVEQTLPSPDGAKTTPQTHTFTCSVLILNPGGGNRGRAVDAPKTEGQTDSVTCKVD